MAIRGITGALMAGPMESPQLTPFPFEAAVNFQTAMNEKRSNAMNQQLEFENALNQFGAIPGTEGIGDFYTKPYVDKANQIIDNYGGDMAAASSDLQNLYFDFSRNMTDDMRAQANAVTAYQAQQANLAKGVEEGKFSSATAAARLNQQTTAYEEALQNYGMGQGARPTGAIFARRPVDTPDFQTDINRIRDDIKPDTLSQAGYDIVDRGGQKVYVERVSKREYSFEEARELEATKALMADRNYIDYASEQYELGLMGNPYQGQKYLDLVEKDSLPPLSLNPEERQRQLMSAGVTDDQAYTDMRDLQLANQRSQYDDMINKLMGTGMTREQADLAIGKAEHDDQQIMGILQGIAGGAAVGAYDKQTLQSVKFPDTKDTESSTEEINPARTSTTPAVQVSLPGAQAKQAEQNVANHKEQIKIAESIINDPNSATYQVEQAKEDLANLQTALANDEQTLENLNFARLFEKVGLGDVYSNLKLLSTESEEMSEEIDKGVVKLTERYTDRSKLKADNPNATDEQYAKVLKELVGLNKNDGDWDKMFQGYEAQAKAGDLTIEGLKADNLIGLARDIRTQFNRMKEGEYITRNYKVIDNPGELETKRIEDRGRRFTDGTLTVYDATKKGDDGLPVALQETYSDNIKKMETKLKGIQGYGNAIITPRISPTTNMLSGEPVFVLDVGYYKPGPTQEAIPIPDNLLETLMDEDAMVRRMLTSATDQRRFAVTLDDQEELNSDINTYIQEQKQVAKDIGRSDTDRQIAARTATQLELNTQYGSLLSATEIELLPSEIFAENQDNFTFGYVNRKVPNSMFKDILQEDGKIYDNNGNIIIDTTIGEHMRVEKTTGPNNSIKYELYPYKGQSEQGRDLANRLSGDALATSAASLEDLIFQVFGGRERAAQYMNMTQQ